MCGLVCVGHVVHIHILLVVICLSHRDLIMRPSLAQVSERKTPIHLHIHLHMVAEQSASAVGDPHVTSVTSEKLDLCKTGRSSFMPISEDVQISESMADGHEVLAHADQYKILRVIKKNLAKKCLEMLAEIAELRDDHAESYEQFGKCLNSGNHEDSTVRAKTAELLRLNASVSEDEQLNLKEYVDRRNHELSDIYSIVGESIAVVSSFLILGILREKSLEEKVQKIVEIPQVHVVEKTAEIPVMTQRQNHMVQTVRMPMETPQLQIVGEIVRDTQTSNSLGTAPVRQGVQAEIGEVVEIRAPFPTESASPVFVPTPVLEVPPFVVDVTVPRVVKELVEGSKAFSQNRVQQSSMEQTVANPAISLVEETVEMPVIRTKEKTQHVVNTHVQHVVNAVETEMSKIINEKINQVTKHVEIPQTQEQIIESVKVHPKGSSTELQRGLNCGRASSTDSMTDSSRDAQMQVPTVQVAQKTVKEIRSKFEVGHTKGTGKSAHARKQPDNNRWREKQRFEAKQYPQDAQERADLTNQRHVLAIRNAHKTVEVPRVQYIDKVADIPVDMQRQVSTLQAGQHIDEVEDVPALTQSEVPNILDDDEDQLEQESKKRKLPMPAEAVSQSRADESDFDRFDDLVLPSPEGKTIFMSIASGDEAEDGPDKEQEMTRSLVQGEESMQVDETDARSPGREVVRVIYTEWSQELREVQRKFADDMTDVKNDLAHVREMLGVLVRRERCAETKAEIAARRLDRKEREQHEADDAEHEANLQEALREGSTLFRDRTLAGRPGS